MYSRKHTFFFQYLRTVLLSLVLCVTLIITLLPQQTQATVPSWSVSEAGAIPTAITSLNGDATCAGYAYNKDYALLSSGFDFKCIIDQFIPSWDSIAWTVAKIAVQGIRQALLNWIRSGFEGKPLFLEDPDRFFTDMADQASGVFLGDISEKLTGDREFFCKDFMPQFVIDIGSYGRRDFFNRSRCTLSNAIQNVENYYENFENGNWRAFVSMQETNNNRYALYLAALQEENKKRSEAQAVYQKSAQYGGGYLPRVDCLERNSVGCKRFRIKTPSRAIGDRVASMVGTDFDELITADEISEVVSAIVDATIKQALDSFLD